MKLLHYVHHMLIPKSPHCAVQMYVLQPTPGFINYTDEGNWETAYCSYTISEVMQDDIYMAQ